ncbi:serine protease inhibitor 3/4-like isoform X3 [Ostrinia nubilalis]|uniref:serine protease inhibitor 3/4-like isoform X3 n=1 Tax=Ostrinia nubilalis TaxID=29057 RepID=UPI00308231EA
MDAKQLASSIAQFSAKFCNELDKNKSVVSSPLSAEILLALLTLGTTEPAHDELLTALGIPDDASIRSGFSVVSDKLKSIKGVTLNVANKVYVMEGAYDLHSELKQDAIKVFDAGFEKVNFEESAAAASLINKWVEDKTNNRIKDLISEDDLNRYTRLVLVNAIYFKGTWSKKFDPMHTMDKPFHVNATTTIQVPMMYKEDNFRYGESEALNAQLLEMSYVGGEASMLIVLPREVEGLDGVLKKLAGGFDLLGEVERKMFSTKVQVTMPKFKIETEIDLNTLLFKLGIKSIFNSKGPSGLTKVLNCDEPLYVSKAVQKAFIEVNEEGAEAAAATELLYKKRKSNRRKPLAKPVFQADRPFQLFIVEEFDTVLFTANYRGNIN